jgi:fimbrial chaperone protein
MGEGIIRRVFGAAGRDRHGKRHHGGRGAGAAGFLLVVAATLLAGVSPAAAFRLVPFSATFTPSGSGATQSFRVDNDGDQPVAVQISIEHREMAPDGKEKLTDAEDEFAVIPAQIVLLPKQGQTVRVQWLGDAQLKTEGAYRIIAEQLPVPVALPPGANAQISMVVRYEGTIYVTPPGLKPDLVLNGVEPAAGAGAPMLAVTVENRGGAHALLGDLTLALKGQNGAAVTLNDAQLKGMVGENVLAGHTRRFVVPWPAGLPQGPVQATLKMAAAQ